MNTGDDSAAGAERGVDPMNTGDDGAATRERSVESTR